MAITRSPFRVSFFGGGTDMPAFFEQHGGAVVSTTIDKYCYTHVRDLPPFFDYATEAVYAKTERVACVGDIEHPLIRNALCLMGADRVHLAYDADLPARTGLGTSSAFAVGMLLALHALQGHAPDPSQLASEAIHLERELCGEAGGWQDQVASAFGGFNRIDFSAEGFAVAPVAVDMPRLQLLQSRLMLFFTGFTRLSASVQDGIDYRAKEAECLEMLDLADRAQALLEGTEPLEGFGRLLDSAWQVKRRFGTGVTNDHIDALYQRARNAGALGGKLLGAGGGGFLLLFAEPDARKGVLEAMEGHMHVPFAFEQGGARVVYFDDGQETQ